MTAKESCQNKCSVSYFYFFPVDLWSHRYWMANALHSIGGPRSIWGRVIMGHVTRVIIVRINKKRSLMSISVITANWRRRKSFLGPCHFHCYCQLISCNKPTFNTWQIFHPATGLDYTSSKVGDNSHCDAGGNSCNNIQRLLMYRKWGKVVLFKLILSPSFYFAVIK